MFTQKEMQAVAQLRRAVQMFASSLPETEAQEVATVYPRYETGRAYQKGQYVTDGVDGNGDPVLYRVAQSHTSEANWPPAENPALYTCVSMAPGGYPIWSPPTGAQDAYSIGDVVEFGGTLYRSKIDGNVWSPEAYSAGWEIVSDPDTE